MKPSRRTITTRNRFTTSTRNWWVNTTHLFSLSFVLLLAACADNPLEIGFKKEPRNFEVLYRELPVESSTFLADSVLTYNNFVAGTSRLLIGSYVDPVFGRVTSRFYSQIVPSNSSQVLEGDAVFDSVTLKLRLDFYHYGSRAITPQRFKVFLVNEEIDNGRAYANTVSLQVGRPHVAETSITISPDMLDEIVKNKKNDTIQISTILNPNVGRQLFGQWRAGDTTFTKFTEFKKRFYGIAVVPEDQNDKILGINPNSSLSKLVLHYHVDTVKKNFDFYFANVTMGYSQISSERINTPLSSLINPREDFVPADNKVYYQSGVGIFSKLDFFSLVMMKDTIPDVSFNSVKIELPIEPFAAATPPPPTLALKLLSGDNELANFTKLYFSQYLIPDQATNGIYVRNDTEGTIALTLNNETNTYEGYITRFAQTLISEDDPDKRFTQFALFPFNPDASKSVDRLVFDRNKIKLKVYYTKGIRTTTKE